MELGWIVIIIVVLIVIYYFWSRLQPSKPGTPRINDEQPDVFEFDEDTNQIAPNVRRKVRFVAPPQNMPGGKQRVKITADKLPSTQGAEPPAAKNITLDTIVIEPQVQLAETNEVIYDFDPALEMTIFYKQSDAAKTTLDENGVPRLSIITGYHGNDGWKFERLPTTVTPDSENGGGTLTGQVSTLHPQDPAWVGHP